MPLKNCLWISLQLAAARPLKPKTCVACGSGFRPRYAFSVFCDYCQSPVNSLLGIQGHERAERSLGQLAS
jgi:hypothetical protein